MGLILNLSNGFPSKIDVDQYRDGEPHQQGDDRPIGEVAIDEDNE